MATIKKQVNNLVEKAEFWLSDGTHVVWMKDTKRWHIALYKYSHNSRDVWSVGRLPSIANAIYFAKRYPLTFNE